MNKHLHLPLWFHYTDCDMMARFLERMAAKGWHFRSFRLGMEFEKGEKENVVYDVQPFLKNSEMDTAPEPETEEFAAFCEAAGWQFIDSQRRFMVFKRVREDAIPVYEEADRLKYIAKAERRVMLEQMITMLVLTVSCGVQSYTAPEIWFTNNALLITMAYPPVIVLLNAVKYIALLIWERIERKKTGQGQRVVYGKNMIWRIIAETLRILPLFVLIVLFCFSGGNSVWSFWIMLILLAGMVVLTGWVRPSRQENWIWQIAGGIGAVILVFVIMGVVLFSNGEVRKDDLSGASLRPEEVMEISREAQRTEYEHHKSLIAEMEMINASYPTPGYEEMAEEYYRTHEPEDEGPFDTTAQTFHLEVYRYKIPWIGERIWEKQIRFFRGIGSRDDLDWGAAETFAGKVTGIRGPDTWHYYIRYEDALFHLELTEPLTQQDVELIRQRLGV